MFYNKLCILLAISALVTTEIYGQSATGTFSISRKQCIARSIFAGGTPIYSQTLGNFIETSSSVGSENKTNGRYEFHHAAFTNTKIQQLVLTIKARSTNTQGLFPAIAHVVQLNDGCNSANSWTSPDSEQQQSIFNCIMQGTSIFNEAISVTSALSYETRSFVLDHSGLNPGSTYITIGLNPVQFGMEIESLTITVTYATDPAITNNTVCCNQTLTGTTQPAALTGSTSTGGNGTYTYQWQQRTGTTWANIPSATAKNYNPSAIAATTYYRRIVSSGTAVTSASGEVQVILIRDPAITGNALCCDQSVSSTTRPETITGSTPTGGNGTYAYAWQKRTGTSTWSEIGLATGKDYTPPALILSTTYYRRRINSGTEQSYSNEIEISVSQDPAIGNNVLCCNQVLCSMSTPDALTGSTPSGGSGIYTYRWQQKSGSAAWTDITAATAVTYNPGPISASTYYRRIVSSGNAANSTSGEVLLTVIPENANITTTQYTTPTTIRSRFITMSGNISTSNTSVDIIAGESVLVTAPTQLLPNIHIIIDGCSFSGSSGRAAQPEEDNNTYLQASAESIITVYPNPARKNITINLGDNGQEQRSYKIQLTNIAAQIMYTNEFNDTSEIPVDVSAFSAGIYYIRIQSLNRVIYKKIIIE